MEKSSTSNTNEIALKNEDLHLESLQSNSVSKESVNYKNYFPEALPE